MASMHRDRTSADAILAAVPTALEHPAVQRVLDVAARKGVTLEVIAFPDSTHTAADAARVVDAEIGQIVKSLVFVVENEDATLEAIVCLVSGADRVDLGRLAAVIGRRDVRRATAREADELTGFTIGGIPPFGHKARVVMDPELGRYATVWAAAGLPTAVFPVAPSVLRMLADAHVAPIAEEPPVQQAS
jgi:prolyl-tRNA editing enzyme YbaK/EbsC (Cys-tRNA(Pro) deacylase)